MYTWSIVLYCFVTYAFNLALTLDSALAALAGKGAKTPVVARAAAEKVKPVAKACERNWRRESPSSSPTLLLLLLLAGAEKICVVVAEFEATEGANPLTAEDAIRANNDVHRMEVFMVDIDIDIK
jgi:hypothetical protein